MNDLYILGISAFYHDSAACILHNGRIVVAFQEERLSRIKHDASFPNLSIEACLSEVNISNEDLTAVVYYEKSFVKFDRIIDTFVSKAPKRGKSFVKAMRTWMTQKIWIKDTIYEKLAYDGPVLFSAHHESHAAGAYFASPFNECAILVVDGVGERSTMSIGVGKGHKIEMLYEQTFPHSLGLLYSAFTQYCGFKVNSGEYKLMGLAAYGQPLYKDAIYKHLIEISDQGVIKLNLEYFDFEVGDQMINSKFENVLGKKRRTTEAAMDQFYKDVARSIQDVLEEILLIIIRHVRKVTGLTNLCMSGGVALNCKANQALLDARIFENRWVQPAAGDAGGTIGAAYLGYHHYLDHPVMNEEVIKSNDTLVSKAYLGRSYTDDYVAQQLQTYNLSYEYK